MGPNSHSSGPNFDKPKKNDEKTAASSKIHDVAFNAIKKTSDPQDVPEIQESVFEKWIIPTPADQPLSDADFYVFKDSFSGSLPLNGIREGDFHKYNELYKKLEIGSTKVSIEGSDDFKTLILSSLKKLIERESGRELLDEFFMKAVPEKVEIKQGEESETGVLPDPFTQKETYVIRMDTNPQRTLYIFSTELQTNKKIAVKIPFFMTLAHEMVHVLHLSKDRKGMDEAPTLSPRFHNMEEQVTISGMKAPIPSDKVNLKDDDVKTFDLKDENWEPYEQGYDVINESRIAASFGYYTHRSDHTGFMIPESNILLASELFDSIKKIKEEGEFEEDAKVREQDLRTLLHDFVDSSFDPSSKESSAALQLAILLEDSQAIETLHKKGTSLDREFKNGTTPLNFAIEKKMGKTVDLLMDLGANINNIRDGTPLQKALMAENFQLADLLLQKGANGLGSVEGATKFILEYRGNQQGLAAFLNKHTSLLEKLSFSREICVSLIENSKFDLIGVYLPRLEIKQQKTAGLTLFSAASRTGDFDKVKRLLNVVPPSVDFLEELFIGDPSDFSLRAAKLVVDKGVNINELTSHRKTILGRLVIESKTRNIISYIEKVLEWGADPSIKDRSGKTCLQYADENDEELMQLLRSGKKSSS
jgi:ankyrin repeat protein